MMKRRQEIQEGHRELMAQWRLKQNTSSMRQLNQHQANPQEMVLFTNSDDITSFSNDEEDDAVPAAPPKVKRFKFTSRNPFRSSRGASACKRLWFIPKLTMIEASLSDSQSSQDLMDSQPQDEMLENPSSAEELKACMFKKDNYTSEDSDEEDLCSPQHMQSSALFSEDDTSGGGDMYAGKMMMTCERCGNVWDGQAQCMCDDSDVSSDSCNDSAVEDDDEETDKENIFVSQPE